MGQNLKEKTKTGVMWSGIERFASQGIQFLISIVIARILLPSDFGTIALLNVFLAICQTFIDSGFGLALMRKKKCSEDDFSTVFIFSVLVSIISYGILWSIAPWIADFYNIPILIEITRIVSLNVIINAISNVPNAILSISLDFKKKAIIAVLTVIISGSLGLWLAFRGFGVWALVYQTLIASALRAFFLFMFSRWMPIMTFSKASFNELFSFGSKMLISGIIGNIYNNLTSILIGKFFSTTSLGLYGKATTFANYPSMHITGVILNVAYPVLAKIQDEEERLIEAYRKMLKMSCLVIFPLMIGLASVATPFVQLILGKQWLEMIPLLQVLCFAMMWDPINGMNMNLLQVKGYSNIFLKVDIYKKIIGVIVLCVTIPFGLKAICYGLLLVALVNIPLNTYFTCKFFGYGFKRQIKDVMPIFIHSIFMGLMVVGVTKLVDGLLLKLILGICCGIIYYVIIGFVFLTNEFEYLIKLKRSR